MANIGKDGELDDRVRLKLGGVETKTFESYSVSTAVLTQPSAFSARLGSSEVAAKFFQKYPPRTSFQLMIGDLAQFTGETDGFQGTGSATSTSITLKGRDLLARLHDADVTADTPYAEVTYEDMVKAAMKEVGLGDRLLIVGNAVSREAKVGRKISGTEPQVSSLVTQTVGAGGLVRQSVRAKMGETWLNFCLRHLESVGLFLWTDFEGNLVLSKPNPNQKPSYRFIREVGSRTNRVNITDWSFNNDTTHRFSEIVTWGRAPGRGKGRGKIKGDLDDAEMIEWGYDRPKVFHDSDITNGQSAIALAKRRMGEANRAGWQLTYTFQGHTVPSIDGRSRVVVAPDTVAQVQDDELGINEPLYIESVEYHCPPTQTVVTMMRLKDVVF
jgi:prophage tail gpP-like protein